jgi:hypothetical protein
MSRRNRQPGSEHRSPPAVSVPALRTESAPPEVPGSAERAVTAQAEPKPEQRRRRKDTRVRALAALPWHGLIREAGSTFYMSAADAKAFSARGRVEIVTE